MHSKYIYINSTEWSFIVYGLTTYMSYYSTRLEENVGTISRCLNSQDFNPLNPELNPICYLLALLAHHFLHVSRIQVKSCMIIITILT
jgi:hypothetical protein